MGFFPSFKFYAPIVNLVQATAQTVQNFFSISRLGFNHSSYNNFEVFDSNLPSAFILYLLQNNNNITDVNFVSDHLTENDVVRVMANHITDKHLQTLKFQGRIFSEEDMNHLVTILHNNTIDHLDLSDAILSRDNVEILREAYKHSPIITDLSLTTGHYRKLSAEINSLKEGNNLRYKLADLRQARREDILSKWQEQVSQDQSVITDSKIGL